MKLCWYAYLIKLARPLGSHKHSARFYLGSSQDWVGRFALHCKGRGSKFLAAAVRCRIALAVVRVWRFDSCREAREFERYCKLSVKSHQRLLKLDSWLSFAA